MKSPAGMLGTGDKSFPVADVAVGGKIAAIELLQVFGYW